MESAPTHIQCNAKICKHWQHFYKGSDGCVYIKVEINSRGKCTSFARKRPYPRTKK